MLRRLEQIIGPDRRRPPSTTNTALDRRWDGAGLDVNAFSECEYRHTVHNPIEGVAVGLDRLGEEQHGVGMVVLARGTDQGAFSCRSRLVSHHARDSNCQRWVRRPVRASDRPRLNPERADSTARTDPAQVLPPAPRRERRRGGRAHRGSASPARYAAATASALRDRALLDERRHRRSGEPGSLATSESLRPMTSTTHR